MEGRLVIIVSIIVLIATLPHVTSYADSNLQPSKDKLNLIVGSAGSGISINYTGTVSVPQNATRCDAYTYFLDDYGLKPHLAGLPSCDANTGYVYIPISFDGAYNGVDGYYYPIINVTITFYDANDTVVGKKAVYVEPIYLNRIGVNVTTPGNPISGNIEYEYTPNKIKPGDVVRIYTSGTVILNVNPKQPPDVDSQLLIKYYQQTTGWKTKSFTVPEGASSTSVFLDGVDLSAKLTYRILSADGSIEVDSGIIDIPTYTSGENEMALIMPEQPYLLPSLSDENKANISGGVYVETMPEASSVKITLSAGDVSVEKDVDDAGMVFISLTLPKPPNNNKISGFYSVTYTGKYGSVSFQVPFEVSGARVFVGGIITKVFYYTFLLIVVSSFLSLFFGFYMRRPDLMTSGLLGMASSVMVFMIPTVIAYVLTLLFATGVPDPAHVGNVNMMTLGSAVDNSVRYTTNVALWYSSKLRLVAMALIGVVGSLAVASAGIGAIGWLTGGALSQFIGRVAGELASQLILMSVYSFITSYMLEVLAYIYPVILNTVLIVMFFTIILYALYAGYTGNIGQIYGPLIQFSIMVLAILLVPPMLGAIDVLKGTPGIGRIAMPPVINKIVKSVPNPFFWLAASFMQIIILVTIMYMAFNRLVSILGGGGG